jgi:hypothetical protein
MFGYAYHVQYNLTMLSGFIRDIRDIRVIKVSYVASLRVRELLYAWDLICDDVELRAHLADRLCVEACDGS